MHKCKVRPLKNWCERKLAWENYCLCCSCLLNAETALTYASIGNAVHILKGLVFNQFFYSNTISATDQVLDSLYIVHKISVLLLLGWSLSCECRRDYDKYCNTQ
jgi:hypothetical protein